MAKRFAGQLTPPCHDNDPDSASMAYHGIRYANRATPDGAKGRRYYASRNFKGLCQKKLSGGRLLPVADGKRKA